MNRQAARRVTETFHSAHREIEWRAIIGQRNILAHQYGAIDHERLYKTGTESILQLVAALEAIVPRAD